MIQKIKIPIGKKRYLVAEKSADPDYGKEMYIYIERNKIVEQDIAIVSCAYKYKSDGQLDWSDDKIQVLVYSDSTQEDYTDEFIIDIYEEDTAEK